MQLVYFETKNTAQLKDVFERAKRDEILADAFAVNRSDTQGKSVLIFDDLFRSGATAGAITRLLLGPGAAAKVYLLTLTDSDAEETMTSVFIGGSRAVSKLNDELRAKLDDFMARGCTIFVGDANGADKAIQQYLAARQYSEVVVYCMDRCRNNAGSWPTKRVNGCGGSGARDFAYYAEKDRAMATDAKCGMMLWDGASKGTLNNIQNLLAEGKKTLVYFSPERTFYKLTSGDDLQGLLDRCRPEAIADARRRIARATGAQTLLPV